MATKSHSLTANDRALRVGNAELLKSALQSSGRTASATEREVLAAPSTFDVNVERVRRYVDADDWREPSAEEIGPRRTWSSADAAVQTWRDVQSSSWRRAQAAAQRAEAAARRAEAAARRAEAEIYRRSYRYESNEVFRRRRN
jgi:hypothetical protein